MKTLRPLLLLVPFLVVLLTACGSDSKSNATPAVKETPTQKILDVTIGAEKDNGTVTLPKGAQLTVRLESNHTTGYQWSVKQNTPAVLAGSSDPQYEGPPAGSPPGRGGTDVFTFRAVGTGTAALQLVYARSFEPNNPPAKTFSVTVNVTQ